MHNAQDVLSQINWFLKPISDIILFVFTTRAGMWILIILFFSYLTIPAFEAVKVRRLAYKAASGNGKLPVVEAVFLAVRSVVRNFAKFITQIPVVLVVIIILFIIVGISTGLQSIDNFVKDRNKIRELQTIFRQLDQRFKVAEITINTFDNQSKECAMTIKFYNQAIGAYNGKTQDIKIKGSDIYFDALILNFDYSEIASGEKRNIVLPYRVFSELVPQEEGVLLNLADTSGVPYVFARDSSNVFGLSIDRYNENIKYFSKFLTDPKIARKEGVRSAYGNAVHKKIKEGQILTVWVEQTGGLVLKEKDDF